MCLNEQLVVERKKIIKLLQQLCFRVTRKTDQSTQSFLFDKTLILTLPPTLNWGSAFDLPRTLEIFFFLKECLFFGTSVCQHHFESEAFWTT